MHKPSIAEELKKLPNQVTLLRLLLFPVLTFFTFTSNRIGFSITFIIMGLSDFFDGYLARKMNICSDFGNNMDSIADDLIYFFLLPVLYFLSRQSLFDNIALIMLTFGVFMFNRIITFIKFRNRFRPHLLSSKLTAYLLYPTLLMMIWVENYHWIFILFIVAANVNLVEEVLVILTSKKPDHNIKSFFFKGLNKGKRWIKD